MFIKNDDELDQYIKELDILLDSIPDLNYIEDEEKEKRMNFLSDIIWEYEEETDIMNREERI